MHAGLVAEMLVLEQTYRPRVSELTTAKKTSNTRNKVLCKFCWQDEIVVVLNSLLETNQV